MITYTLDPDTLREGLRTQIQAALVSRHGPPRRKIALMAREVGCEPKTISSLFTENGHLPIRIINRFTGSLCVSEEVRTKWTSAAQLIEWARGYQSNKVRATRRMRALSSREDLPLWSRWIAERLAALGWSLTDLSRALGHKSAAWGKKGGAPAINIRGIVRGRIVPRDFHKIERVLGEAPVDVKRAARIARRRTYAASTRLANRSMKRTRSRWTKYRLTNEVHRILSGNIPIELRNRLARLDPNRPVGVEGYHIYASATGTAVARKSAKALFQARHKPKTATPRLRLAHRLLRLERGQSALLQCLGCSELQIRSPFARPSERCQACWREFMKTPTYGQWASERHAALRAGRDIPPLPAAPKKSGRRSSPERLRECLVIYLRHALGRLDNDERLDRKDDLEQAGRLLATTRNRRAREMYELTEELLP